MHCHAMQGHNEQHGQQGMGASRVGRRRRRRGGGMHTTHRTESSAADAHAGRLHELTSTPTRHTEPACAAIMLDEWQVPGGTGAKQREE